MVMVAFGLSDLDDFDLDDFDLDDFDLDDFDLVHA
jgi:hypothetical protein